MTINDSSTSVCVCLRGVVWKRINKQNERHGSDKTLHIPSTMCLGCVYIAHSGNDTPQNSRVRALNMRWPRYGPCIHICIYIHHNHKCRTYILCMCMYKHSWADEEWTPECS